MEIVLQVAKIHFTLQFVINIYICSRECYNNIKNACMEEEIRP